MSTSIASILLARAGRELLWSDADSHSRGTILHPEDLVGHRARPWVRGERFPDGFNNHLLPDGDIGEVEILCAGARQSFVITDADVTHLVQSLLQDRAAPPPWCTPASRRFMGVRFLLLDEELGRCRRHSDPSHRAAWVCRAWLAFTGEHDAIDLASVDFDLVRAELAAIQENRR